MVTNYPEHVDLIQQCMGKLGQGIPKTMQAFGQLHQVAAADGALSHKTKELLALAIGVTVRCKGCIGYHVHDSLKAGASREEILETLGVAILMGGGPSVMYACEAMRALEQFEKEGVK